MLAAEVAVQAARVAALDARFINSGAVVRPLDFLCVGVGNMADLVIACTFFLAGGSGRRRQRRRSKNCLRFFACWRFWKAQAKEEK